MTDFADLPNERVQDSLLVHLSHRYDMVRPYGSSVPTDEGKLAEHSCLVPGV